MVAIDGALALICCLLIVQMWLLTAGLESYLAGHHQTAVPGAILSGVLFCGCLALFLFVKRLEKQGKENL
jgi:predicted Co/Zn/Cd cation transporter (cation efflux family)